MPRRYANEKPAATRQLCTTMMRTDEFLFVPTNRISGIRTAV